MRQSKHTKFVPSYLMTLIGILQERTLHLAVGGHLTGKAKMAVDPCHKWRRISHSFVFMLIRPTGLILG